VLPRRGYECATDRILNQRLIHELFGMIWVGEDSSILGYRSESTRKKQHLTSIATATCAEWEFCIHERVYSKVSDNNYRGTSQ
jgi:hypothetical protein